MEDIQAVRQELRTLIRELYAPLHSAMHAAGSLAKTGLDSEQRKNIEMIEISLRLLREIIQQATDFQRRQPSLGSIPAVEQTSQYGIEMHTLQRLRGINANEGVGLFEELIFGFLEQSTAKLYELEQLVKDKNLPNTVQAAHTLKGMSLNFGAVGMASECEKLQRMAESSEEAALPFTLESIKDAFAVAREGLMKSLKSNGSSQQSDLTQC